MIRRAADVAALLAGFATLAIVLLVSYDVLMRYFFDRPQLFVDELASFLQVLVIFGGAGDLAILRCLPVQVEGVLPVRLGERRDGAAD